MSLRILSAGFRPRWRSSILCGLLLAGAPRLKAATLWSIYWTSAWMPCGDGVMLLSSPPHTVTNGTPVSIAQRLSNDDSPWGRKLPITIIGYSIIHEVRGGETGQQTWMLVGSASGGPGADVFAMTAGQGNSSPSLMFPPESVCRTAASLLTPISMFTAPVWVVRNNGVASPIGATVGPFRMAF